MRVLTTWMYFDYSQIQSDRLRRRRPGIRDEGGDPGIAVAWFGGGTATSRDIDNLKVFHRIRRAQQEEPLTEEFLRDSIDLFLVDAEEFEFVRPERPIKNSAIVDHIITQPIVIERSPPITVTLKGLLTSTNLPIWIGTYMGWQVAPEHSILLFVTVPGGIIVVSSAAGMAQALGAGLSKSVKRLFEVR